MLQNYKYMDDEDLVKQFRKDLYAKIGDPDPEVNRKHLANIIGYDAGHLQNLHIGLTDGQLIQRQLEHDSTNKHWVQQASCFFDDLTAEEAVMTALYRQAPEVLDWAKHGKTGSIVLTIDSGDEDMMFGRGFDEQFREKESPVAKIILDRDPLQKYGFFPKTAVIDISVPQAEFTGVSYDHAQIADMDDIKFGSVMEEVAFAYQKAFSDVHMKYGISQDKYNAQGQHDEYIKLSYNRSDTEAVDIYITNDGAKAKLRTHGQSTQRLKIEELEPGKRDMVSILQQTIRLKEKFKDAPTKKAVQEKTTTIQPPKDITPEIPKSVRSGDAR